MITATCCRAIVFTLAFGGPSHAVSTMHDPCPALTRPLPADIRCDVDVLIALVDHDGHRGRAGGDEVRSADGREEHRDLLKHIRQDE